MNTPPPMQGPPLGPPPGPLGRPGPPGAGTGAGGSKEQIIPPRKLRQYCMRLIREVTGSIGWKYKLYIPASVAISLVFLLPPQLLKYFVSGTEKLTTATAADLTQHILIFGAIIAVCLWLGIFLSSLLREWLRLTVSVSLRRNILKSLQRTKIEALDTAGRGEWLTRMTSDLRNCEHFLTDSIPEQVRQGTLMVGTGALFFFHSGVIAIIPCSAALLLAWLNIVIQKKMGPTLGQVRQLEGGIFQGFIESFEGLRTIRSYGGEGFMIRRLDLGLKKLVTACMKIIRRMGALTGANEMASQIVVSICLTAALFALSKDKLTMVDALIYPFYINLFLDATKTLVASAYEWNRFFFEGGRMAAVFYDEDNHLPDDLPEWQSLTNTTRIETLTVSDLTVAYHDSPPVIDGFEFEVKGGEIVALMGQSGCGKSTFMEVLAGLRLPTRASFQLQTADTGGINIPRLPVNVSAYVEQNPYIFVGSFRENFLLGLDPATPDEVIWDALEKVDLKQLVQHRGGLEEVLTDRGMNLSEGQRYRIALTRALLANRPMILLDEPFAALDEESMKPVISALHTLRDRGACIVIITHVMPPALDCQRTVTMVPINRPTEIKVGGQRP